MSVEGKLWWIYLLCYIGIVPTHFVSYVLLHFSFCNCSSSPGSCRCYFSITQMKWTTLHLSYLLYFDRYDWNNQLLMSVQSTSMPFVQLLEAVACLINPKLPWNCKVVGYLQQKKIYCLFRGIITAVPVCSIPVLADILLLSASLLF